MESFGDVVSRIGDSAARVGEMLGGGALDDFEPDELTRLVAEATELRNGADLVIAAAAAVIDRRSSRDLGLEGIARRHGHRTATSLLQNLTGQSRADVGRAIRAGHDLLGSDASGDAAGGVSGAGGVAGADGVSGLGGADAEGADAEGAGDPGSSSGLDGGEAAPVGWRELLTGALLSGRVTTAQQQAIRGGLGEPPVERYPDRDPAEMREEWARAVELLLDDAGELTVEDLKAAARVARDRLDPIGTALRFEERYQARSYRRWIDERGQHHAHIAFDDESAAWADAVMNAALRPRRGPRFVGEDAKSRGEQAVTDERTNEQLQFDTLLAVLRTGAAADPEQAFGDRQPGVRIVVEETAIERDGEGGARVIGVGHLEDGGGALPGSVVEKYLCDAGSRAVAIDGFGRPLDVGREKRLFTPKQRIAIAVRDGGCIGIGCSAPPAWTEIHHIDQWHEHHGRTDVDDGVPMCRFHHLDVHNRGARIRRERDPVTGRDVYWMHLPRDPATGVVPEPIRLRSRSPRRFAAA